MPDKPCFLCSHSDVPKDLWKDPDGIQYMIDGGLCKEHEEWARLKVKELSKTVYVLKTTPAETKQFIPKQNVKPERNWQDREPGEEG